MLNGSLSRMAVAASVALAALTPLAASAAVSLGTLDATVTSSFSTWGSGKSVGTASPSPIPDFSISGSNIYRGTSANTAGGNYNISGFDYQPSSTAPAGSLSLTGTWQNNTGAIVTSLDIAYDAYLVVSRASRINGWTVTNSLGGDTSSLNWLVTDPNATKTVTLTGLSIASGATFTLAFASDRGTGAGSSPLIGLNNIKLTPHGAAALGSFWVGADSTLGGDGNWLATDGNSWAPTNTNAAGTGWDQTKTATFGGVTAASAVSVSGTVAASKGLLFTQDGYTLSGGTITLSGAATDNLITVNTGAPTGAAIINATLDGTAGLTKAGPGILVLGGSNTFTGNLTITTGVVQLAGTGGLNSAGTNSVIFGAATPGGTKLQLNGNSVTVAGLGTNAAPGAPVVENGSSTADAILTVNNAADNTFAGVLQDGGANKLALSKSGAGVQTLTGANTYTGGTSVTGGTLQIGNGGAGGSLVGDVALSNNSTITFNRSDDSIFPGLISGAGAVNKMGVGTMTMTSSNSYTQGTVITGGTLLAGNGIAGGSATGDGGVIVNSGGTIGSTPTGGKVGGSVFGMLVQSGGKMLPGGAGAGGTLAVSTYLTLDGGAAATFDFTPSAADLITLGTVLTLPASGQVAITLGDTSALAASNTLFMFDALADLGGQTVNDKFSITNGVLGATYTFAQVGNSIVLNVAMTSVSRVWTGAANNIWNIGGAANWTGAGNVFVNNDSVTFDDTGSNTSIMILTAGAGVTPASVVFGNTAAKDYTIGGDAINGGTGILVNGGGHVTLNNNNGFTGSVSVSNGSTLTLNGANSYAGATTVGGNSTVEISSGAAIANTSGVTLGDGATVRAMADLSTDRALTLTTSGGSGGIIDTNGHQVIDSGNIGGTGALTKTGGNTLILTGAATHAGGTTVSGGTLQIGNDTTTGSLAGNVSIAASAALAFQRADDGTFAGDIAGNGALIKMANASIPTTLTLTGNATHTGGTSVLGGTLQIGSNGTTGSLSGDIAVSAGANVTFNRSNAYAAAGNITGDGSVTKLGGGILTLAGSASSYTGGTTLSGGTTKAATSVALGTGTVTVTSGNLHAGSGVNIANAIVVSGAAGGGAATLANWTFETSVPTSAGPFVAEDGVNAATSNASGFHAGGSTYSNPAGNGSSHSFSSTNWAIGDYYQFTTSATGYTSLTFGWDQTSSNTGPGQFKLQYSLNGTSFVDIGSPFTVLANAAPNPTWSAGNPHPEFTVTQDLSSIGELNNAAAVTFRLVDNSNTSANGGSVASGGTDRIDNVIITGQAGNSFVGPVALGSDITSGTATFSGNISLNSPVSLFSAPGGTVIFSGVIADGTSANSVTKTGGGTVILTSDNTYNFGTEVNAGTLLAGNGIAGGSVTGGGGGVVVHSGGTLGSTSAGGKVGGTVFGMLVESGGALLPGGAGTGGTLAVTTYLALDGGAKVTFDFTSSAADLITLTGALTLPVTGQVAITLGDTSALAASNTLFTFGSLDDLAGLTVNDKFSIANPALGLTYFFSQVGNAIVLNVTGLGGGPQIWTGAVNGHWDVASTTNWANGTYGDSVAIFFDNTGANPNITIIAPAGVAPASMTFTNDAAHPYSFSGDKITGATGLSITGGGSVTLNNNNDFTGAVSVTGGSTLILNGTNSYSAATTVGDNSTLQIATGASVSATSGISLGLASTLKITSTTTLDRNIALAGVAPDSTNPATIIDIGNNTVTYTGKLTSAATTNAFTKLGTGTLILAGLPDFTATPSGTNVNYTFQQTGDIQLSQGTIRLDASSADAFHVTALGGSKVYVRSGAVLQINNISVGGDANALPGADSAGLSIYLDDGGTLKATGNASYARGSGSFGGFTVIREYSPDDTDPTHIDTIPLRHVYLETAPGDTLSFKNTLRQFFATGTGDNNGRANAVIVLKGPSSDAGGTVELTSGGTSSNGTFGGSWEVQTGILKIAPLSGIFGEMFNSLGFASHGGSNVAATWDANPVTLTGGILAAAVNTRNEGGTYNTVSGAITVTASDHDNTPEYFRSPITLSGGAIATTALTDKGAQFGGDLNINGTASRVLTYDPVTPAASRNVGLVAYGATNWNGTLSVDANGTTGGTLTIARAPEANFKQWNPTTSTYDTVLKTPTVSVAPGATLSIGTGATVAVDSTSIDPFTDSVNPTKHVAVANAGTFILLAGAATVSELTGNGSAQILGNAQLTASRIRQTSLTIGDGTSTSAKLTIPDSSPTFAQNSLVPSGDDSFVSVVKNLTIANSGGFKGTLDLGNNDLIIDYTGGSSPITTIEAMVKSGYNGGNWTGKGITSSTAAQNTGRFALTVIDNNTIATHFNTFDGVDTTSHQQVIVKFSWVADLDLNGVVNSNDAITFAAHYSEGAFANHQTGDLNYNGVFDSNDAILFAAAYSESLPHLPEPASLGILALGAGALLIKRRK